MMTMMMMMTRTTKHICTAGVFAVAYTRKSIVHSDNFLLLFVFYRATWNADAV